MRVRPAPIAALVALALTLALPAVADAFKPKTQFYLGDQAANLIIHNARNTVEIGGKEYPVPDEVGNSIRRYPQHFRGGLMGTYAFPDVMVARGAIQSDTRTRDSTRNDPGPGNGRSFSWEWLAHIHDSGWKTFRGCDGCDRGQQALAFSYGYILGAAGNVFGHTVINERAEGLFPRLTGSLSGGERRRIARHIVIEEYIARHTPGSASSIDQPGGFQYDRFIDDDTAAELGRGPFIDSFARLIDKLKRKRDDVRDRIRDLADDCLVSVGGRCRQRGVKPENLAKYAALKLQRALLDAWIPTITAALRVYPDLSEVLARSLFIKDVKDLVEDSLEALAVYIAKSLVDAVGFGVLADLGLKLDDFVEDLIDDVLAGPLRSQRAAELFRYFLGFGVLGPGGVAADLVGFVSDPALYINSSSSATGLPGNTSQKLDEAMGLTVDGFQFPTAPFELSRFPAGADAVMLMKLALLDGDGLNAVLLDLGVPPRYDKGDNVMMEWTRSLAGDHQWRETSTRDNRRYGEGTFPLWEDCAARQRVFRVLFRDWENGADNFPDLGDAPAGCHGWTTVNEEDDRFEVRLAPATDGADSVLFRLRTRTLDPAILGSLGGLSGRTAASPAIPLRQSVSKVYARRHLETPAESISFTYETGGEGAGLATEVLADGRKIATLTAPGPVTLDTVNAREITFRLVGAVRLQVVGTQSSRSFFARVSHFRTTTQAWEGSLSSDASGLDYGTTAQAGDGTASASFVTDPGVPLAGFAELRRRYQQPIDKLEFRYEPSYNQTDLEFSVLADGQPLMTVTGAARDISLTGLNAREITFRWRALQGGPLGAMQSVLIKDLKATMANAPMPTGQPPPPPNAPADPGIDLQAPRVTGLKVRVRKRGRKRGRLEARFRVSEQSTALVRLDRKSKRIGSSKQRRLSGTGTLTLTLGRATDRGGRYTALVAVRDEAGNVAVARKTVRIKRLRRR